MEMLIQKVLNHCGYDGEATEQNLIECFYDYVDTGAFSDLNLDQARLMVESGEISLKGICNNLMKVR